MLCDTLKENRGVAFMDNKIKVVTPDNQTLEIEVLDIFNVTGYEGKDYILYSLGEQVDNDHEQAYISILEKSENDYNLTEIKDAQEWDAVQKAIAEDIKMEQEASNE